MTRARLIAAAVEHALEVLRNHPDSGLRNLQVLGYCLDIIPDVVLQSIVAVGGDPDRIGRHVLARVSDRWIRSVVTQPRLPGSFASH